MSRHGPRAARAAMLIAVGASCGGGVPERVAVEPPVPGSSSDAPDGAGSPRLLSEPLGSPSARSGSAATGGAPPSAAVGVPSAHPAASEPAPDAATPGNDASTLASLRDARSLTDRDDARGDADEAGSRDASGDAYGRDSASDSAETSSRDGAETSSRDSVGAETSSRDSAPCPPGCGLPAPHLLISEVVFRPSGAEMIELRNPTSRPVSLDGYALSDSHRYAEVAAGLATIANSDFAARFPLGASIEAGGYRTVALGNASGGSASFELTHGRPPDFELRPRANGATDDTSIPDMTSFAAPPSTTIGVLASLTDEGEPIVLFRVETNGVVRAIDYVFFGRPSAVNPLVDEHRGDAATDMVDQHPVPIAASSVAVQRCGDEEPGELSIGAAGNLGHDETSEETQISFVATDEASPGAPPPSRSCAH